MKDYSKLQSKLRQLLSETSPRYLDVAPEPWDLVEFRRVVSKVQEFVDSQDDSLEYESLTDWVTEAKFFLASEHNRL